MIEIFSSVNIFRYVMRVQAPALLCINVITIIIIYSRKVKTVSNVLRLEKKNKDSFPFRRLLYFCNSAMFTS